jgi:hypothetical protein
MVPRAGPSEDHTTGPHVFRRPSHEPEVVGGDEEDILHLAQVGFDPENPTYFAPIVFADVLDDLSDEVGERDSDNVLALRFVVNNSTLDYTVGPTGAIFLL